MKRLVDIVLATFGLIFVSPVLFPVMLLIWLQDFHSPFYIAPRVGVRGKIFQMVKLRSMVMHADKTKVDSTSSNDKRITMIGKFVRKTKLDEFGQLWNVLKGEMSLVGPRPNVQREVALYTSLEMNLLNVRPGITDFSSVVFSDEGDILKDHPDPDLGYNQLIRPWKSRLGLFYIEHSSVVLDLKLLGLTLKNSLSRPDALKGVQRLLKELNADTQMIQVSGRIVPLVPFPPPGQKEIVKFRDQKPNPVPAANLVGVSG